MKGTPFWWPGTCWANIWCTGWTVCRLCGRITETEAYIGRMDKACHAYGYKRTPRTQTLFSPPGTAYLYLIYGMYHCLSFVTEPEGEPLCGAAAGGGGGGGRGVHGAKPVRLRSLLALAAASQREKLLNGPG
ncbi:MAG: DNA-3-methyladenine glycosylase [Intestinimonas sp.]